MDEIFLQRVVELHRLVHSNDLIHIQDIQGQIILVSSGFLDLAHKTEAEVLGRCYLDIASVPSENVLLMQASFDKVIQTREVQNYLSVNLNRDDPQYYVLHIIKSPIINPETNNILGASTEFRKIDFPLYFHKLLLAKPKIMSKNITLYNDTLLSAREHEIAFLLFYCRSSEEIASIINLFAERPITAKTIRNIVRQQLYPRLHATNSEELMANLRVLNYHKKPPNSLLTNLHIDFTEI